MIEYKLNKDNTFAVEDLKDKLRLIVLNAEGEMACRKVTLPALKKFMEESNGSIFKGRLQLHKFGKEILITVSGERIGSMPAMKLSELISQDI